MFGQGVFSQLQKIGKHNNLGQLPSPLDEAVKFDLVTNRYQPILFFNSYWNLANEYQPVFLVLGMIIYK